jgi:hypothetical protein
MKQWVTDRRGYLESTLVTQTTLEGVPDSPYLLGDPVIALSGQLNQCWTHEVLVNGVPADSFNVVEATWAHDHTLVPGPNDIVVQLLDHHGTEVERVEASVDYDPPDPPLAYGVGSRYLLVTPPPGLPSVALRVEAAGLPCMPKYVDATGDLVDEPVFRSSQDWGTVTVTARAIVPDATYELRSDVRDPLEPQNLSGPTTATTWAWGDADNNGIVDLFDLVCVLDGFQDLFARCTLEGDDLRGDVPNGIIDLFDIVAVLDAFQALPYPDATPCGSTTAAAPSVSASETFRVRILPRDGRVAPGGTLTVDVFADGEGSVRGAQVGLRAEALGAERSGWRKLESVTPAIDGQHERFVFAGRAHVAVTDVHRQRLAVSLTNGLVEVHGPAYLGTFAFRLPVEPVRAVRVTVSPSDTVLLGAAQGQLDVRIAPAVVVAANKSAAARSTR